MLKRKTPLKSNHETTLAWKQRSAKKLPNRSTHRGLQEVCYSMARPRFLAAHRICPVTGEPTTQIHHSAKREGRWINLQRYWIAVSATGHQYIEDHKSWAENLGLMVRIREDAATHIASLILRGIDLNHPIFYDRWDGEILLG